MEVERREILLSQKDFIKMYLNLKFILNIILSLGEHTLTHKNEEFIKPNWEEFSILWVRWMAKIDL